MIFRNTDEIINKKREIHVQNQKDKFKNFSSNKTDLDSFAEEIFKKIDKNVKNEHENQQITGNNRL